MRKQKPIEAPAAVDVLYFLGAALVSAGIGLLAGIAAGMIAAGVFFLAAAWLCDNTDEKGGDERR